MIKNGKSIDVSRNKRDIQQVDAIDMKSVDAQLIADFIEHGYYHEQTCNSINLLKQKENNYRAINREPRGTNIETRSRFGRSPFLAWRSAFITSFL